ncbi:uncharacterized protein DUF2851 [Roseivirga pacifica]|uniref:DUF2851 domain-containing protein n=1 Tax=Roseivirga pacifica TaxID=1267423 RepID=A0A1I0R8T3_9BACT|nr:DUF2851 family protein [Roseivirga pacifica]RKQ49233.1 uncharacterized protein DUF2851 [Roseivirga pacifica]SEW37208.1 Protein of unknown function [Roseivirga pacifica]
MQESFLHYIWKNQLFNKRQLQTVAGQPIEILHSGFHNLHAGPDFKEAKLSIDGLQWVGAVEIHVKSSDWYAHNHQTDENYDGVVLHVVFEHDKEVLDQHGNAIPTLLLKGLIKPGVLKRYEALMLQPAKVLCESQLKNVRVITRLSMLERALVERINQKSAMVLALLEQNNGSWDETAYQWLARGMGFKTNAEQMLCLAQSVPIKFINKHHQLRQKEALLFGASGLLNVDLNDSYANGLKEEYLFLKQKYNLKEGLSYNEWHFARVRPANYPTIRIPQLAALLAKHSQLFQLFIEAEEIKNLQKQLQVETAEYWSAHHRFDAASSRKVNGLSKSSINNLIINVTVPLLGAYARYTANDTYMEQAVNLLSAMPKEQNSIVKQWQDLGWNVSSAFDSQGLLQLYRFYCSNSQCIACNIGAELIKQ